MTHVTVARDIRASSAIPGERRHSERAQRVLTSSRASAASALSSRASAASALSSRASAASRGICTYSRPVRDGSLRDGSLRNGFLAETRSRRQKGHARRGPLRRGGAARGSLRRTNKDFESGMERGGAPARSARPGERFSAMLSVSSASPRDTRRRAEPPNGQTGASSNLRCAPDLSHESTSAGQREACARSPLSHDARGPLSTDARRA